MNLCSTAFRRLSILSCSNSCHHICCAVLPCPSIPVDPNRYKKQEGAMCVKPRRFSRALPWAVSVTPAPPIMEEEEVPGSTSAGYYLPLSCLNMCIRHAHRSVPGSSSTARQLNSRDTCHAVCAFARYTRTTRSPFWSDQTVDVLLSRCLCPPGQFRRRLALREVFPDALTVFPICLFHQMAHPRFFL